MGGWVDRYKDGEVGGCVDWEVDEERKGWRLTEMTLYVLELASVLGISPNVSNITHNLAKL